VVQAVLVVSVLAVVVVHSASVVVGGAVGGAVVGAVGGAVGVVVVVVVVVVVAVHTESVALVVGRVVVDDTVAHFPRFPSKVGWLMRVVEQRQVHHCIAAVVVRSTPWVVVGTC
jgi:hypothetical protein